MRGKAAGEDACATRTAGEPKTRNSELDTPLRRAVLLVGGLGTRLRPLTHETPKHLVPVANRPLIYYPLEMLRQGGVGEVTLACGYRADRLRKGMARFGNWGLSVRFVEEDSPLGTAGAVRNAALGFDETFLAMNGDQITGLDVRALAAEHRRRGAAATLVLRRVPEVSAFGLILCDDDLRVRAFVEKVDRDETGRNLINAGVYVLEPSVLDLIPEGVPFSNEYELFPALLALGQPVYGFVLPGDAYWADVGTPANYLAANAALLRGALPSVPPVHEPAEVAEGARLHPPVSLAGGCRIASGAQVGPATSLGEGVRVGRDAVVRESIVWPGAEIGEGAQLDRVIVAPDCRVAADARVTGPTILASGGA